MSGLLQLQVKGWARMIGTRLFALAPALTVAIVSNVSTGSRAVSMHLGLSMRCVDAALCAGLVSSAQGESS